MTTLFIANTSKSNHDFSFRRPEAQFPTVIHILAGTQVAAIKDGDSDMVDSVIDQHRRYGLLSAQEAAKSKRFVGLCYSIDKPVTFKDMKVVFEHNDKALEEQGREQVANVAAAVNENIDQRLEGAGIPSKAAHVAVEVKEENAPGQDTKLAVGVEVVKEGGGQGQGRGGRGGSGRGNRNR